MPRSSLDAAFLKAARSGDLDTVAEHMAEHADVNAADSNGRTGLYLAAAAADHDMVKLLLAHKADPNICDDDGLTPLTAALQARDLPLASLLLKNGAAIDLQPGEKKMTALHAAVNMDLKDKEAGRTGFLLEQGADFTTLRSVFGQTAREAAEALRAQWPEAQVIVNAFDAHIEGKENHARRLAREAAAERDAAVFGGLKRPVAAAKPIRFKAKAPGA